MSNQARESTTMTDATACTECGVVIDTREWHPVTTVVDDGEFLIFAFCGQGCRQRWRAAQPDQPQTPTR